MNEEDEEEERSGRRALRPKHETKKATQEMLE